MLHELLESLEIENSLRGPYTDGRWRVRVGKKFLEIYLQKVGFNHPRKLSKLSYLVKAAGPKEVLPGEWEYFSLPSGRDSNPRRELERLACLTGLHHRSTKTTRFFQP